MSGISRASDLSNSEPFPQILNQELPFRASQFAIQPTLGLSSHLPCNLYRRRCFWGQVQDEGSLTSQVNSSWEQRHCERSQHWRHRDLELPGAGRRGLGEGRRRAWRPPPLGRSVAFLPGQRHISSRSTVSPVSFENTGLETFLSANTPPNVWSFLPSQAFRKAAAPKPGAPHTHSAARPHPKVLQEASALISSSQKDRSASKNKGAHNLDNYCFSQRPTRKEKPPKSNPHSPLPPVKECGYANRSVLGSKAIDFQPRLWQYDAPGLSSLGNFATRAPQLSGGRLGPRCARRACPRLSRARYQA